MSQQKTNILGLFLYNEIRTGAHRRYLELMDGLSKYNYNIYLLINKNLLNKVNCNVKMIPLDVKYKHGQIFPISFVFLNSIKKNIKYINNFISHIDWIIIFSTTNIISSYYLKKVFNAKILYGHRSNPTREYLTFLKIKIPIFKKFIYFFRLIMSLIYEYLITSFSDKIVFQSSYDFNDFKKRNLSIENKAFIINGNIGYPRFKPEFKDINNSKSVHRLLFIGHTYENKGLKYLIEALNILKNRGLTNIKLDVLGPGDTNKLNYYILKNELSDMIFFHGKVDNPFLFLSKNDLLIVPSLSDSFPDTILEALHVGIPVLGSKVGGIPEILFYEDLLFNPADPLDLSNKLYNVITDDKEYKRIRLLCSSRVNVFIFDWINKWNNVISS